MSAEEVSWVFSSKIKEGALERVKAMIAEMCENTQRSEPGTLAYEWTISEDGKRAQVHERYRDSKAASDHLDAFNTHYAARLMELVEPAGMVVFGAPDAALKQALGGTGAVFMHPAGGFRR